MINRLLSQLSQQIPQRKVDATDCVQREALAPIEERRQKHLFPDLLDVRSVCANKKPGEMPLDDPRSGLAARRHGKARHAILCFDLYNQCAQNV